MALIVGRLLAQLGIDDTGFSAGMNGARQEYQRTGQSAAQLAQQVEKSAARVQSARASEQAAAVRVQAAEQALAKLRASGTSDTLKMAQAESRLQSALASQNSAALRAAESSRSLAAAKRAQAQGADQVAKSTQRATQETNNLARAADVAKGALAAMGIGFSVNKIVDALTQSVAAARALGAQTNQMSVIFGDGAKDIEAWGQTAVTSMRMSQREAQGAAVQFAAFGQAMGLSGDELVAFSKQQTKLAADLASFQGMPVEEAISAMGSAFAGQVRPMRQYGVLLDEAKIKQAAYANGVAEVGTELTAAQKTQGIYYAMMEQLSFANGDVERSNGKFGASMKTLTARLEETQAAIGQKLIPVIHPFIDLLAGPGLGAMEGVASALGAVGSAFGSLPGPVQAALAAMVLFRVGARLMGTQVVAAGQRVVGALRGMTTQATVMSSQGAVQMGRFGSAVAGIGRHVPVIARMQTAFVNAAAGASHLPRTMGVASAAMTGLKGAAGGLMGALGGPWGLAIAGATAALGFWMKKKSEDAAKSEEAKAATMEWADALTESKGAIDSNVRELARKKIAETGAYSMAKELGVSTEELTDKVLQGKDAYMQYYATLKDKSAELQISGDMNRLASLSGIAEAFETGKTRAMEMAEANGDVKLSFDGTQSAAGRMSEAMTEFSESTDGASSKVDKLVKSLNELRDDELTQEEALQSWSDNLRDLVDALGEGGAAMVQMDGSIDVTQAKGSKLQDTVRDQADAYNETAAAALEYAKSQKMGAGESLDYVNGKLAPLRQKLIDTAIAAGVNAESAKKMADRYLGVPGEITTNLMLKGAEAAVDKLKAVRVEGAKPIEGKYTMVEDTKAVRATLDSMKVKYSTIDGKLVIDTEDVKEAGQALDKLGAQTVALPEGYVEIGDTSDENMARLKALGIATQTLPDGTIVINANDAEFWRRVQEAQKPGSKTIHVQYVGPGGQTVDSVTLASGQQGLPTPLDPSKFRQKADGGVTEYASGGVRPAGVPSMPDQAVIEKGRGSGLVRWAEGETWWESYIPGAPSKRKRSTAILAETARRFGYQLWPTSAPIRPYADGGVTTPGLTTPTQQSMWDSVSAAFPGAKMSSGTRYADVGSGFDNHMGGTAIDITASASEMMSIANWIADNYPDSKELIHGPGFARQIKDGKIVGDGGGESGFYAGAGRHDDHVHWAMSSPVGAATGLAPGGQTGVPTIPLVQNPDGTWTSSDPAWAALIARESGGDPTIVQGVQDANSGGNEASGLFQIAKGTWAGAGGTKYAATAGEATPEQQAEIAAAIFNRDGGSPWGAGLAGRENEDALRAGLTTTTGPTGTDPGGLGATSGSGTPVYVTNWPSGGGNYSGGGDTGGGPSAPSLGGGGGRPRIIFRDKNGRPILNGNDGGTTPTPSAPSTKTPAAPKASSVESAKVAVEKAQRSVADATERQRIAEMKLDEVRSNPKAKPSQIASAEQAVVKAKNAVTDATDRQRIAEMRLQELQANTAPVPSVTPVKRLNGGTIPGVGRGDIIPMLGEPGEEVIRRPVAEKYRALLKQVNRTGEWPTLGQVPRYQSGGTVGFGGYADDTSDYMKPKSWNDLLALGVGGAFMAADLVQPYLAMAQSGNIDLGSLSPQLNTGTSDADLGIPQMVGEYADDIKSQLAEIARLLAKGERITVHIEQDKSESAARMVGMAGRV